jgi:hypothetical protein
MVAIQHRRGDRRVVAGGVTPDLQITLLQHILGQRPVSQDAQGDAQQLGVREAVEACEGGFVAARDFREELQRTVLPSCCPVVACGVAFTMVSPARLSSDPAAPGHPALEGPYVANTDCRRKKFRRRRIGDDFLAPGGPASFETPAR